MQWINGKLRSDFMHLATGTKVVYAESPLRYTSIGRSYLLYDGERIFAVAETFGGPGMMGLVLKGKPHSQNDRLNQKTARIVQKMAKYLENAQALTRKSSETGQIGAITRF